MEESKPRVTNLADLTVECRIASFFGEQSYAVALKATAALRAALVRSDYTIPPPMLAREVKQALSAAGFKAHVKVKVNRVTGFRLEIRAPGDQRFRI